MIMTRDECDDRRDCIAGVMRDRYELEKSTSARERGGHHAVTASSSSKESGHVSVFHIGRALRIRAHPDAYLASRALVTIPIRRVRMGAGIVPLHLP